MTKPLFQATKLVDTCGCSHFGLRMVDVRSCRLRHNQSLAFS